MPTLSQILTLPTPAFIAFAIAFLPCMAFGIALAWSLRGPSMFARVFVAVGTTIWLLPISLFVTFYIAGRLFHVDPWD